jgi:hypothetical protein
MMKNDDEKPKNWKSEVTTISHEDAIQLMRTRLISMKETPHPKGKSKKKNCSCLASALSLENNILAVAESVVNFYNADWLKQSEVIHAIVHSKEEKKENKRKREPAGQLDYPLKSIGTWNTPLDPNEEGCNLKICKDAVMLIFDFKKTRWDNNNKLPVQHGGTGKSGLAQAKHFEDEFGTDLKDFWEKSDKRESDRTNFERYCWSLGYECTWGHNKPTTSEREDADWMEGDRDRKKHCSWTSFTKYTHIYSRESCASRQEQSKGLGPGSEEKETHDLESEGENTGTLLQEEYSTKENIRAYSQQLDEAYQQISVEEKEYVLIHQTLCEGAYKTENKPQAYQKWKHGLAALDQRRTEESDSWIGKEQPSLPDAWPPGYTFDDNSRVLVVNFKLLSQKQHDLFFRCLERDDIAVVSEGLVKVDPELWSLDYLIKNYRAHIHHSFQKFMIKDGSMCEFAEEGMNFEAFKEKLNKGEKIYMTDFNLDVVPTLEVNFKKAMTPNLMPGKAHCLMQHVSATP